MVPFIKVTQDRVVLEIQRWLYPWLPFLSGRNGIPSNRERDLEFLKDYAIKCWMLQGMKKFLMSSLSSSDYSLASGTG